MEAARRRPDSRLKQSLALLLLAVLAATTVLAPASHAQGPGAPTVTSVSPNAGALAGGTAVTITGTGFIAGASVTFGGVTATGITTVTSPTTITATTPPHAAGAVTVMVTNADTNSGSLANGFTYQTAPDITAVTPTVGPLGGSTTVTITGTGFRAGAAVSFGGTAATSLTVNSATAISATSPPHAAGAVAIAVTNSDSQTDSLAGAFTYQAAPTITSIAPSGGPMGGGTAVTIAGTGFLAGATVSFGGAAATVGTLTTTSIGATAPAHALGAVTVTVTNSDGQSAALAAGYTYGSGPTVTSVSPNGGPPAGGTLVTITGTGFVSGANVKFGSATAGSPTVVGATSITALTPANAAGPFTVSVLNPDTQTGTLAAGFTYRAPPTIVSLSRTGGALAGGTNVTLTGTGFITGVTVRFDGTLATNVRLVTATSLTAITPAHAAGAVAVTATNTDTQVGTLPNGYTYAAAPTLASMQPNSGALAGGTSVTLTGSGFVTGAAVSVGGKAATAVTVASATSITATTASHAAGKVAVKVTNPDGQNVTVVDAFTYQAAPTVTSVYPKGGLVAGETNVTVRGMGFLTGATVKFGGISATSIVIRNDTAITALTPAHAAGAVTVLVTNLDAQSSSLAGAYTYSVAPTIVTVAPNGGPLEGGNIVTLTGTGFSTGANVTFGGVPGTGNTTVNSYTLLVVAPAHAAGAVAIKVTNPDGNSTTLGQGYSFDEAPHITAVTPASGSIEGGTTLTVTGSNFKEGAKLAIGSSLATNVVVVDAGRITAKSPAHAAGIVDLVVTNPLGTSDAVLNAYTYLVAAPTISSVSPNKGSVLGGAAIVITGTGFATGATVELGGQPTVGVVIASPNRIEVLAPAHAAGKASIVVTNPDGQEATLANGFEFVQPLATTTATPTEESSSQSATSSSASRTKESPMVAIPATAMLLVLVAALRKRLA